MDDCVRRRRWVRYYMQHDNESLVCGEAGCRCCNCAWLMCARWGG